MRTCFCLALVGGLAACALGRTPGRAPFSGLVEAAEHKPIASARAAPHQTPIIDPLPVLRPAYLPFAVRAHNPLVPDPLSSTMRGYVAVLRALGRGRCAPATHVLLDKPEGRTGANALAVLRAPRRGPNLDLYVGAFVELTGTMGFAPAECAILTEWLIEVSSITVIELPPGTER